jgi:UDP-N-acetylmuramate--alanine ligase
LKIFFSGIGGSGVSALAGFSSDKGHSVTGSDRLFDRNPEHRLNALLKANSIKTLPQDGIGIDKSLDLIVFSTAVEPNNPDFLKARELGLMIKTRPEYLADLVEEFKTVAVAGTSGKSTVAGMLAYLMEKLDMEPNFVGGGRVKQLRTPKNPGNYTTGSSDLLIIEACESDSTIVNYKPSYSIILNLDLDHHSIDETAGMFEKLSYQTSDLVISGHDDKYLANCNIKDPIGFSIDEDSKYRARDIEYLPVESRFSVRGQSYRILLPGKHNVYNALACIAFLSEFGMPAERIAERLSEFTGIERRFDVVLNDGRYLVIDDYAHNPHKISNLMKTMQNISNSVCFIFQPHGYGPTRFLKDGYIRTFIKNLRDTDHLILLPIYYAGGTVAKDISSRDIEQGINATGASAEVIEDRGLVFEMLDKWNSYVVFGARDDSLSDFAMEISRRLRANIV